MTTCFYYDDQRVIYEAQTRPEGLEERVFVYGNYIDEVLVMRRKEAGTGGWSQYFYGHDHLYSPTVLFLWYGMVMERYEYDAYGKVHVMDAGYNSRTESAFRNPVAFTGRTLDRLDGGSLEIMYYRARYYDPETGRFMRQDPLGYVAGINLYEYVKSIPSRGLDPLGLKWCEDKCTTDFFDVQGYVIVPYGVSPTLYDDMHKIEGAEEVIDTAHIAKIIALAATGISASEIAAELAYLGLNATIVQQYINLYEAILEKLIEHNVNMYLRVEYKKCEEERCWVCWKRKNYKAPVMKYFKCRSGAHNDIWDGLYENPESAEMNYEDCFLDFGDAIYAEDANADEIFY